MRDDEKTLMMIRNQRDKVVPQAKQDGGGLKAAGAAAAASARTWTGLRDPRIVRVSRSQGGKDRHSKVSTIRGLRDRRVRLSVPTAVQLYDLQDRLGLNQPSKVVDWLLDAARHEIDKLPPLEIPPGSLLHCPPSMAAAHHGLEDPEEAPMEAIGMEYHRAKRRDSTSGEMEEKDVVFFRRVEQEQQRSLVESLHGHGHASMLSMSSSGNEYNTHMEALNLCVPHLGCYPMSQGEELHGYRPVAPPPSSSVFSPYAAAAAAAAAAASAGYDHKHANGTTFQMGSSASQGFMLSYLHASSASTNMRPLQVSISAKNPHCHDNHESNTE